MEGCTNTDNHRNPEIIIFPKNVGSDFGSYRIMAIISTLVHEAVHIFLDYYSCRHCKMHRRNNDFRGHGRAWQLVAVQLEDTFPRLLGIPLNLGRREALWSHWNHARRLPSPHDLASFKLQNRYITSNHDIDVFGAAYSMLSCYVLYMLFSWMEE
ncbi:hypothetical protein CC86DRAFT_116218 [Ophiobolus disseminans]|uniref:SprT-like domain-containing protein n=1 Tax=Ophiobolus disseminans TaxID=1469910 RepID=A0A6A6ZHX5_9PLEO|nr:hypothetical protein CC86DRAFT_116218 [Ophiobolus disseminans]